MGIKDEAKKTAGNKRLRTWESPGAMEEVSTPTSATRKNGPKNSKLKEKKAGKRKSSISSSIKVRLLLNKKPIRQRLLTTCYFR